MSRRGRSSGVASTAGVILRQTAASSELALRVHDRPRRTTTTSTIEKPTVSRHHARRHRRGRPLVPRGSRQLQRDVRRTAARIQAGVEGAAPPRRSDRARRRERRLLGPGVARRPRGDVRAPDGTARADAARSLRSSARSSRRSARPGSPAARWTSCRRTRRSPPASGRRRDRDGEGRLRRAYAKAGLTEGSPYAKRRALCKIARQRGWI